jgi:CrcB protein
LKFYLKQNEAKKSMLNIILIAIGGAVGTVLRYIFGDLILKFIKSQNLASSLIAFPWPTFFINILGSLIMGFLYFLVIKNLNNFDVRLKNLLFVGVLGGFTTFSTFSLDFFRLFMAGQYLQGFIYIFTSVLLSILALFFGFYLAKIIFF